VVDCLAPNEISGLRRPKNAKFGTKAASSARMMYTLHTYIFGKSSLIVAKNYKRLLKYVKKKANHKNANFFHCHIYAETVYTWHHHVSGFSTVDPGTIVTLPVITIIIMIMLQLRLGMLKPDFFQNRLSVCRNRFFTSNLKELLMRLRLLARSCALPSCKFAASILNIKRHYAQLQQWVFDVHCTALSTGQRIMRSFSQTGL